MSLLLRSLHCNRLAHFIQIVQLQKYNTNLIYKITLGVIWYHILDKSIYLAILLVIHL